MLIWSTEVCFKQAHDEQNCAWHESEKENLANLFDQAKNTNAVSFLSQLLASGNRPISAAGPSHEIYCTREKTNHHWRCCFAEICWLWSCQTKELVCLGTTPCYNTKHCLDTIVSAIHPDSPFVTRKLYLRDMRSMWITAASFAHILWYHIIKI